MTRHLEEIDTTVGTDTIEETETKKRESVTSVIISSEREERGIGGGREKARERGGKTDRQTTEIPDKRLNYNYFLKRIL